MKYLLLLTGFVLLNSGAKAQRNTIVPYEDKLSVRFSPMGLVDIFDGNLTAGVAYALTNRFTVSTDISFIAYSVYFEQNRGAFGYIFKPALRYYLSDKRRIFIEAAPFYKRVGYRLHDWLGMETVDGVPSYTEFRKFTFQKNVVGLNTMFGFQKGLTRTNNVRMEIYAGVNFRYKWQRIKNEPRASYDRGGDFFNGFIFEPDNLLPGLPHGLRLVYVVE